MGKLIYEAKTLFKMYAEFIRQVYPELTGEQIEDICKYQFTLVKREIEKGTLETIRIKYLGSFRVFKGRVIGIRNRAKKLYEEGKMKQEEFNAIEEMHNAFLEETKDEEEDEEAEYDS